MLEKLIFLITWNTNLKRHEKSFNVCLRYREQVLADICRVFHGRMNGKKSAAMIDKRKTSLSGKRGYLRYTDITLNKLFHF